MLKYSHALERGFNMPNTKFYTGKGDGGTTLLGKCKVPKDDVLFQLLGGMDELNSWIGLAKIGVEKEKKLKEIAENLSEIQQMLFVAQAEIASLGAGFKSKIKIKSDKTKRLEKIVEDIDKKLPAITKFIVPGGSEASARIDVGRAMARKIERAGKSYSRHKKMSPDFLQFLNRLSSVLFALARYANWKLKIKEQHPEYR